MPAELHPSPDDPPRRSLRARAHRIVHATGLADAAPGRRFQHRFERRAHLPRLHPARASRLLLGLVLFTVGMLNVFVPGPGGSVFIFASALVLSGESRTFARLLDRGEVRFQPQVRWMLRHPLLVTATITTLVTGGVAIATLALATG